MKILFIVTLSELGGAQKYVRDLAVAYAKEGHEVIIAAGGEPEGWMFQELSPCRHPEFNSARLPDGQGSRNKKEKDLKSFDVSFGFLDSEVSSLGMTEKKEIKTFYLKHLKRSTGFFREFQTLFDIVNIIKRERPDILHLNSTKVGGLGGLAGRNTNTPSVYTVHGLVLNEPLPIFLWVFYWFLEKIAFATCDKIIVISKFDEQSVLKFHLAPKKKLSLVPLTIDPEQLNFLPRDEARQNLVSRITKITKTLKQENKKTYEQIPSYGGVALATGVWETPRKADRPGWVDLSLKHLTHPRPTDDPSQEGIYRTLLIGTIANFYPTKDLFTLIDAAKIVVVQKPEARFIIIGDGPLRQILESRIMNHELSDHVFLIGRMENASQYLLAFDLFVLSSIKEGLPQVLWEAAAAGIPVVATNIGGIPDIYEYNFLPSVIPGLTWDPETKNKKQKELSSRTSASEVWRSRSDAQNEIASQSLAMTDNWLLIPPRDPQLLAEKILFALDHLKPEPQKTKETLQEEFQKFTSSTKSIYLSLLS